MFAENDSAMNKSKYGLLAASALIALSLSAGRIHAATTNDNQNDPKAETVDQNSGNQPFDAQNQNDDQSNATDNQQDNNTDSQSDDQSDDNPDQQSNSQSANDDGQTDKSNTAANDSNQSADKDDQNQNQKSVKQNNAGQAEPSQKSDDKPSAKSGKVANNSLDNKMAEDDLTGNIDNFAKTLSNLTKPYLNNIRQSFGYNSDDPTDFLNGKVGIPIAFTQSGNDSQQEIIYIKSLDPKTATNQDVLSKVQYFADQASDIYHTVLGDGQVNGAVEPTPVVTLSDEAKQNILNATDFTKPIVVPLNVSVDINSNESNSSSQGQNNGSVANSDNNASANGSGNGSGNEDKYAPNWEMILPDGTKCLVQDRESVKHTIDALFQDYPFTAGKPYDLSGFVYAGNDYQVSGFKVNGKDFPAKGIAPKGPITLQIVMTPTGHRFHTDDAAEKQMEDYAQKHGIKVTGSMDDQFVNATINFDDSQTGKNIASVQISGAIGESVPIPYEIGGNSSLSLYELVSGDPLPVNINLTKDMQSTPVTYKVKLVPQDDLISREVHFVTKDNKVVKSVKITGKKDSTVSLVSLQVPDGYVLDQAQPVSMQLLTNVGAYTIKIKSATDGDNPDDNNNLSNGNSNTNSHQNNNNQNTDNQHNNDNHKNGSASDNQEKTFPINLTVDGQPYGDGNLKISGKNGQELLDKVQKTIDEVNAQFKQNGNGEELTLTDEGRDNLLNETTDGDGKIDVDMHLTKKDQKKDDDPGDDTGKVPFPDNSDNDNSVSGDPEDDEATDDDASIGDNNTQGQPQEQGTLPQTNGQHMQAMIGLGLACAAFGLIVLKKRKQNV